MSVNGDWKFPGEVRGWLSEREGRRLAELAEGKRVLEIGAFAGRSTICMAQVAASVDVIDPLDGRATPTPCDHSDELVANLKRYKIGAKIHCGTTEEMAPTLDEQSFDLVFIDGDHSLPAVQLDIKESLRLLKPGGVLAFHDYGTAKDPAVAIAVNELLAEGAEWLDQCESIAVVQPKKAEREKLMVLLAQPRRGGLVASGSADGYNLWPLNKGDVVRIWARGSILDHCFNRVWATAINLKKEGATHLGIIHDDVCPPQGWLSIMLQEQIRLRCGMLSANVAIKTPEGLTSTAVETDDPWCPRRLTLTEVHALPPTIGDADVGGEILLNTGLCVIDLRQSWVDTPTPMVFQTLNRIVTDKNGLWQAQVRSEDWEFSRAARARGATLFATRKVCPTHLGEMEYRSDRPDGAWQTDNVYAERMERKALAEAT